MFALFLEYSMSLLWGPNNNIIFCYCQKCYLKDPNKIFKKFQVTISIFIFMSKMLFEGPKQNLQKIPCRFKTWMGFVGQIWIKLEASFIWGFLQLPIWYPLRSSLCKHAGGNSVTSVACTLLARVCVVWRSGRSMELSVLWSRYAPAEDEALMVADAFGYSNQWG